MAPLTLNVYAERLGYLARYLEAKGIDIEDVTKQDIQQYPMGLIGTVSDETVNGRIRVYRRFFNYLEEEGLWDKPNLTYKIKLIKTEKRIKPVISPEQIQVNSAHAIQLSVTTVAYIGENYPTVITS